MWRSILIIVAMLMAVVGVFFMWLTTGVIAQAVAEVQEEWQRFPGLTIPNILTVLFPSFLLLLATWFAGIGFEGMLYAWRKLPLEKGPFHAWGWKAVNRFPKIFGQVFALPILGLKFLERMAEEKETQGQ